jgi:hypothetical protein
VSGQNAFQNQGVFGAGLRRLFQSDYDLGPREHVYVTCFGDSGFHPVKDFSVYREQALAPWPAVDAKFLQPYMGRYESDDGSGVLINIHEGRLMAFPDDAPGVFLMPTGEHTFTPMMTEQAKVVFEAGSGQMTALMFEQGNKMMRFVRVATSRA